MFVVVRYTKLLIAPTAPELAGRLQCPALTHLSCRREDNNLGRPSAPYRLPLLTCECDRANCKQVDYWRRVRGRAHRSCLDTLPSEIALKIRIPSRRGYETRRYESYRFGKRSLQEEGGICKGTSRHQAPVLYPSNDPANEDLVPRSHPWTGTRYKRPERQQKSGLCRDACNCLPLDDDAAGSRLVANFKQVPFHAPHLFSQQAKNYHGGIVRSNQTGTKNLQSEFLRNLPGLPIFHSECVELGSLASSLRLCID